MTSRVSLDKAVEPNFSKMEELRKAGIEKIIECFSVMARHWEESSAPFTTRRSEWSELLKDVEELPFKFKVQKLRREIEIMWEKCYLSDQEKNAFPEFHCQQFSEELYFKHQSELEKLRAFYLLHKELIQLIDKYDEMWKSVVSMQEHVRNPDRLFKNRGATLLQEEQNRKFITKIPHMQKVILKALQRKECEGVIFLIRGQRFSEIIEQHNEKLQETKPAKRSPGNGLTGTASKRCRTGEHTTHQGTTSKKCRTADHSEVSKVSCFNGHRKAVRHLEMI